MVIVWLTMGQNIGRLNTGEGQNQEVQQVPKYREHENWEKCTVRFLKKEQKQ